MTGTPGSREGRGPGPHHGQHGKDGLTGREATLWGCHTSFLEESRTEKVSHPQSGIQTLSTNITALQESRQVKTWSQSLRSSVLGEWQWVYICVCVCVCVCREKRKPRWFHVILGETRAYPWVGRCLPAWSLVPQSLQGILVLEQSPDNVTTHQDTVKQRHPTLF